MGQLAVDAAFIQITPPNEARLLAVSESPEIVCPGRSLERASLVIWRNSIPKFPDLGIRLFRFFWIFHFLVHSTDPPLVF